MANYVSTRNNFSKFYLQILSSNTSNILQGNLISLLPI